MLGLCTCMEQFVRNGLRAVETIAASKGVKVNRERWVVDGYKVK